MEKKNRKQYTSQVSHNQIRFSSYLLHFNINYLLCSLSYNYTIYEGARGNVIECYIKHVFFSLSQIFISQIYLICYTIAGQHIFKY